KTCFRLKLQRKKVYPLLSLLLLLLLFVTILSENVYWFAHTILTQYSKATHTVNKSYWDRSVRLERSVEANRPHIMLMLSSLVRSTCSTFDSDVINLKRIHIIFQIDFNFNTMPRCKGKQNAVHDSVANKASDMTLLYYSWQSSIFIWRNRIIIASYDFIELASISTAFQSWKRICYKGFPRPSALLGLNERGPCHIDDNTKGLFLSSFKKA
uniref:Uncharacterized protein n=1 Tax=Glossina palpalis gambiensis TaxID=67801 RepID=A0A1B0BII3_9MUSC